jgi:hypothetical protein
MSLLESTEHTVYEKIYDYFIKFPDNIITYFTHQDVNKSYTLDFLYDKIDKEIIIIKSFIIESKYSNKNTEFFIQVLQALLFEADYIISHYKMNSFDNNEFINKSYIILKYSSVIRKNYNKYEANNDLIYNDNTLLHYSKNEKIEI